MVMWSKLDLRSLNSPNLQSNSFVSKYHAHHPWIIFYRFLYSENDIASIVVLVGQLFVQCNGVSCWYPCNLKIIHFSAYLIRWRLFSFGYHYSCPHSDNNSMNVSWGFHGRHTNSLLLFPVHGFEYLTLKWWRHDSISSKHELFSYDLKKTHLHNMTFVC